MLTFLKCEACNEKPGQRELTGREEIGFFGMLQVFGKFNSTPTPSGS
jgi:hypothetical protein